MIKSREFVKGLLTSVKIILLRDDLSPVLGALSRQLLGLIQAADGESLDVFLEGFISHLLHRLLHGAEESLHAALQVVGRLLRLDDEAQALHSVSPSRPAEHNVAWGRRGRYARAQHRGETGYLSFCKETVQRPLYAKLLTSCTSAFGFKNILPQGIW